jgi:valyl-tRNA synthetase
MHLLHPFMPFVTEDIYHHLGKRKDDLTVRQFVKPGNTDGKMLKNGSLLKEAITAIRDARAKNELKNKETVKLNIETASIDLYQSFESILGKQVNADSISYNQPAQPGSFTIVGKDVKFYIRFEKDIDTASQKTELLKELAYQKGFLASVEKKLGNEKFVQNAKPEVIANEQKKKADAEAKIKVIEESLQNL